MLLHEIKSVKTATEILDNFSHDNAASYGKKLVDTYGEPDKAMSGELVWNNIENMDTVILKDESISHEFPKPHQDFVYSTKKIDVPSNLYSLFAHVTGSIIIDGLKKTATARCGTLSANAVTLHFVQDVINGKNPHEFDKAKQEYANRITNNEKPSWFKNKLGE